MAHQLSRVGLAPALKKAAVRQAHRLQLLSLQQSSGGHSVSITAKEGNIHGQGVDINAGYDRNGVMLDPVDENSGSINLTAGQDILLESAQNHNSSKNKSDKINAGFGVNLDVSIGGAVTGGYSGNFGYEQSKGNREMHEHENSHVKGTGTVTIKSGNDTALKGAVVEGNAVKADIGGDLTIINQLDSGKAKQNNVGGNLSVNGKLMFEDNKAKTSVDDLEKQIGQGDYPKLDGGDGSFGWSYQNGKASYEGATEQRGIKTGPGGFDITVKGKTKLEGGLISGSNDETKNSLTTGTLETTDLDIHSDSSGMTLGGSSSFSVGDKNAVEDKDKKIAERGETSATSKLPVYEDNDKDGKIKLGISKGEITITNPDDQKQDINTINRDTTNTLTELPALADLNDMLTKQKQKQADYEKLVGDIAENTSNVLKYAPKLEKVLPED